MSEGWHASQTPSSTGASSPICYEILSVKVQSPSSCTSTWIVKTGETVTSEQFKEKSEHFKNLRARITDNHHLGPEGYAGKEKGRWSKEDKAMEEAGSENPWKQYPK